MRNVWLTAITELHVNVQNVLQKQNVFAGMMEKLISMNVNWEENLVERKLTLEFFMKENVVCSLFIVYWSI